MTEARTTWVSPPSGTSADVLPRLDAAFARTVAAKRREDRAAACDAEAGLRDAIDAARDAGVGWGAIADRLGLARGNAYQRYRKRPS